MNGKNGFLGGTMDINSIKLKQTVNLNRRTLTGLDTKLTRFRREKEICTHFISREKEKFLEKQKRILPNITDDFPDNANLRPKSCQAKLQVKVKLVKGTPLIPIVKQRENILFLNKSKATETYPAENKPSADGEETTIDKVQKPRFRKRSFSQPLMKRPTTSLSMVHVKTKTSQSLVDLATSNSNSTRVMKQNEEKVNSKEHVNRTLTYDEVKGCRYLRRTREQRNQFETFHDKTCYCNSCTLTKMVSSPKFTHRRILKSSFE